MCNYNNILSEIISNQHRMRSFKLLLNRNFWNSIKMKGIRIDKFGNESVLQVHSMDKPPVTKSTVLVKIIAAGVNPVDTYIRAGAFAYSAEFPFTPGKDGAGIVEEVGADVSKVKVGHRVFVCGSHLGKYGTYAEFALFSERDVFPLSDSLSFEEGAAIGVAYFTAHRALFMKAKCETPGSVLVHGASGGVGLAAIQLAKEAGLQVLATAGTEEGLSLVKETGADFVFCHKEKNYMDKIMEATDNSGVNCILEMLANVNLDKDLDLLAAKGVVVIVGSRGPVKFDPRKTMMKESSVIGVGLLSSTENEWKEIASAVLKGIERGYVKPVIDRTYPLDEAAQAHKDIIHSKGAKGKLILRIQDTS